MESIIIKVLDTFGGSNMLNTIIILIVFLLWKQDIISIVKSSETERIFFSHGKRLIYKISNYIGFFLVVFALASFFSLFLLYKCSDYLLSNCFYNWLNVFFILLVILSGVFYFLTVIINVKSMIKWKKKITESDVLMTILILFYFLFSLFFVSFFCSRTALLKFPQLKEGAAITCAFINSIFIFPIVSSLIGPYFYKTKTCYSFKNETDLWYIIKPIKKDEFIVGDSPIEDKCNKLKFISYEELKLKELHVSNKIYNEFNSN